MGMKEYYAELERQQSELNIPAPPPPEPKKSLLSEMGTQLQAGLYGDLPSMLGAAGQAIAPVGSSFYEAAKEFRQSGEAIQKLPELQPTAKSGELLAGTLAKGARGIGGISPALAVGALTGPVGAAAAGGALFGGSTYQETKEKTLSKYGLDDAYAAAHPEDLRVQEAKQAGALTGAIQGAGEAAMNYVGGKLVKGFVPGFKKTAEEVMQGYVNPKTLTNFLKAWGTGALAEGATEVIQDEGQAAVERAYGIPDTPKFGEQALESFQGGVGMAALLGPLGVKGHMKASEAKLGLVKALEDPTADPTARLQAATIIAADIAKTDPKAAMTFADKAWDAIGDVEKTGSETYALKMDASVFKPLGEVHKEIAEKAKEQQVVQEELFPQATPEQDLINRAWEQEAQRVAQYQEDDRAIAAGEIAPGRPTFRGLAQPPGARPATDNATRLIEEERAGFAPSMYSAFGDMRTQSDEMRQGPESILRGQASQPVAQAPRAQQLIDEVRSEQNAINQQRAAELPRVIREEQAAGEAGGQTPAQQGTDRSNSVEQAIQEVRNAPTPNTRGYQNPAAQRAILTDRIKTLKQEATKLNKIDTFPDYVEKRTEIAEAEELLKAFDEGRFSRPEVPQGTGAKATQVSQWLGATPAGVQVLDDFTTLYPDNPKNQSAQAVVLDGKVYINASKINSSQQARDILFDHELRHIGLSKMFGGAENLAKEMEKAFKGNEAEIVAFAMRRGYTRSVAEATEEYIVSKAKEAKDMTLLNKVVAAIRTWARKNGFGTLRYSNSEMLKMVAESGGSGGQSYNNKTALPEMSPPTRLSSAETVAKTLEVRDTIREDTGVPRGWSMVVSETAPDGRLLELADVFNKAVVMVHHSGKDLFEGRVVGDTLYISDTAKSPLAAAEKALKASEERFSRGEQNEFTTRVLEEARRADEGGLLTDASEYLRGVFSPEFYDRPTATARATKANERSALRKWATERGLMIDPAEFDSKWTQKLNAEGKPITGNEHDVVFNDDGTVTKRNRMPNNYHESYAEFFDRVAIFNYLFAPDAKLTFKGFQEVDGILMPVFDQKFMKGGPARIEETEAFLSEAFEPVGRKTSAYRLKGSDIIVTDVFGENTRKVGDQVVPMDYVILRGQRANDYLEYQEKQNAEINEAIDLEGFDAAFDEATRFSRPESFTKTTPVPPPNIPQFLKPTSVKEVANGYEITQPYAEPVAPADNKEIMKTISAAWDNGYAMEDYAYENFGKVDNEVYVIDADSLTPKAESVFDTKQELVARATAALKREEGRFSLKGYDYPVLLNPTASELQGFLARTKYNEVRMVADPKTGDKYYAPAELSDHKSMAEMLGLNWDAIIEAGSAYRRKGSNVDYLLGDVAGERFSRETITVDGKERPTTNSNGQPIHATKEGIRNFWKWFGDSKVVDDRGRPLVVYHGTDGQFYEFKAGRKTSRAIMFDVRDETSQGFFFSPSEEDASEYGSNVIPAYISVKNPMVDPSQTLPGSRATTEQKALSEKIWADMEYILSSVVYENEVDGRKVIDTNSGISTLDIDPDGEWVSEALKDGFAEWDWLDNPEFVRRMKERGYDGVKVVEKNDASGFSWFVPGSTQIKSATENTGAFDPKNPDIRFARDPFTAPVAETYNSWMANLARFSQKALSWLQPLNRRYDYLATLNMPPELHNLIVSMARESEMQRDVQNSVLATTKEVVDKWIDAGKRNKDFDASMQLAHRASVMQLHPAKSAVEQGWGDNIEAVRAAWNKAIGVKAGTTFDAGFTRLQQDYHALSKETRQAYLGAVDKMADLRSQLADAYKNSIMEMKVTPEKKAQLLKALELRMRNLKGAYVPLTRFGEYVATVYKKNSDGSRGEVLETIKRESIGELRAEVKILQAKYPEADHIIREYDGRALIEAKANRISPALLEKMKELLIANNTEEGFKKLRKEAKLFLEAEAENLSDDQRELVKNLIQAGPRSQATALAALKADVMDKEELVQLVDTLDEVRSVSDPALARTIDDLEQLFIETLPESSALKNSMHRKGTAGFDRDAVRGTLAYANKYGKTIAYLNHGRKIDRMETEADTQAKEIPDSEKSLLAQTLLKDTVENRKAVMDEKVGELGKLSTKFSFMWYLTSPSMLLVQNSQPWAITLPYLMSRYGVRKGISALWRNHITYQTGQKFTDKKINTFDADQSRAPKDWNENLPFSLSRYYEQANGETRAKILKGLTDEQKDLLALKLAIDSNAIANSISHDAMQYLTEGEASPMKENTRKAMDILAYFQRTGETLSRKGSFMASFELARKSGKDFDASVQAAKDAVNDTLYDYSATNRPRLISGTFGRFFGAFRTYQLQTLGKLMNLGAAAAHGDKQALKELGYIMATNFVLAGTTGLPLAGTLVNFLGAMAFHLGLDDDDELDFITSIREEMLKSTAGQVAMKGAPMLVGADLSHRIGMEGLIDVFKGEPPSKATPKDRMNFYASQILGPGYSAASGVMANFYQANLDGDWAKALRNSTPRPLASLFGAAKLADNGLTDGSGRVIIPEDQISKWDVALMMVGVNPAEVAIARDKERNVKAVNDMIDIKKARLAKDLEVAVLNADGDAQAKAQEAIAKFNQQYPQFGFTSESLATRLRGAMREELDIKSRQMMAAEDYLGREDADEES